MKETVYVETSIFGYLAARSTTNLILAANTKVTQDWWTFRRNDFTIYASELVEDEAAKGDKEISVRRLNLHEANRIFRSYRRSYKISAGVFTAKQLTAKSF